ncbi:hypothetical protein KUCAC02_020821 [Chaenocephalus aceratus]|uniref:Uncharacterized protein n=1 Tax=Chaenocephalus aceratus TaxID=36190 RepID=A0ACB9XDL6_CHAAC|nr:hypothetical protein KUCAC02_020821 [Chaenocephalus aceratus]
MSCAAPGVSCFPEGRLKEQHQLQSAEKEFLKNLRITLNLYTRNLKSEEIQKALPTQTNNVNCRVLKKSPPKSFKILLKLNNRAWQRFISACPCTRSSTQI